MKKGVTLISIVIYLVLFFTFTVFATSVSSNINRNVFMDKGSVEVEKEGLFDTIQKGIFGGVKRPFDGGHGLEGVCTKGENYFNPFIAKFMDHE